jgi:uncharacterized membrane protein YccC
MQRRLKAFRFIAFFFSFAYYVFGIAGVVLAAVSPRFGNTCTGTALGIIAAVCVALVTFLKPKEMADRFWRAWLILDKACRRYQYESGPAGELNRAFDAAVDAVHDNPVVPAPQVAGSEPPPASP